MVAQLARPVVVEVGQLVRVRVRVMARVRVRIRVRFRVESDLGEVVQP